MDMLEKKIRELSSKIQSDEPVIGHFDRFEMKVNRPTVKRRKKILGVIVFSLTVAAMLVIAIMISTPGNLSPEHLSLSDVSPHYANVEIYYTSTIDRQMQLLENLSKQVGSDDLIDLLVTEIETYDKIYEKLCADLQTAPTDERVINAMIAFYQTKLEIINKILFEIEIKTHNSL